MWFTKGCLSLIIPLPDSQNIASDTINALQIPPVPRNCGSHGLHKRSHLTKSLEVTLYCNHTFLICYVLIDTETSADTSQKVACSSFRYSRKVASDHSLTDIFTKGCQSLDRSMPFTKGSFWRENGSSQNISSASPLMSQ